MSRRVDIALTVNGEPVTESIEPRMLLSDFLRDRLALTGTHVGCEHGVCGACTVEIDGVSARACITFAVQADGSDIRTVEGLGTIAGMDRVQQAFRKHHALQCGYCTPGFLMTVRDLLRNHPLKTDDDIRDGLSGNICRCTGYEHIVRAVRELADERDGVRGDD
ncbi:MAG: (2Fe-2S)-binding protein [Sinobacteraceae bacterium]|nr:(2Fe-2S)-binding protein [Rhodobiaceae bacterium]MCP5466000.1 (2Fe-2S)-binding protein [Nevskiaceae bacterium]